MEKTRHLVTRIQPTKIRQPNKENKNISQRRICTQYSEQDPSTKIHKIKSVLKGRRPKGQSFDKTGLSTTPSQNPYVLEQVIGKGTFGTVYKGRDRSGRQVAVKKVLQDKNFKNREHQILKMLNSPYVLMMRDSFFTQSAEKVYLNVVMDYFPCDLYSFLKSYHRQKRMLPADLVRKLLKQMFQALVYLKSLNICHRDIKPHNILIDPQKQSLVVCDFGSAKILDPRETNISYICSRSYRAPQLLFGASNYSTQIDMWSMGCVIVELMTGKTFLTANSNLQLIIQVIKMLGSPTYQDLMAMNPEYDKKNQIPSSKASDWRRALRNKISESLLDLLAAIFVYSPSKRLTPELALRHVYFQEK